VELEQQGGLFAPLQLKRLLDGNESVQIPLPAELGSARGPSREALAA
jgi:segregation and condensation protein A